MRMCWTCNTEHDLDEACRQSPRARSVRADVIRQIDDLFDDATEPSKLGPVFTASYDCEDACCGDGIEEGDRIRADGMGGWIHEGCEDE